MAPGEMHSEHDDLALPALLRAARRTFAEVVRPALANAGYDDLPANGPFVLGAIARSGAPLSVVIRQLGVSKQAGGHLIDTLVARGYLDREVDTEDRRRLVITLTERGQAAAAVVRQSVEHVEALLVAEVGRDNVRRTRRTLVALAGMAPTGD